MRSRLDELQGTLSSPSTRRIVSRELGKGQVFFKQCADTSPVTKRLARPHETNRHGRGRGTARHIREITSTLSTYDRSRGPTQTRSRARPGRSPAHCLFPSISKDRLITE